MVEVARLMVDSVVFVVLIVLTKLCCCDCCADRLTS